MEGLQHAEPKDGASNPVAAASEPSSGETDNGHVKFVGGMSNPISSVDGVAANQSKVEPASSNVSADNAEGSSAASANDMSNNGSDGRVNASPKPKIRIKLKLSPKRNLSEDANLKNDEDVNSKSSAQAISISQPEREDDGEDEEDWLCLKCINNNESKRIRCWNCKGWKGGKRENFNPNKNKEGNEDGDSMDVDSETAVTNEAAATSATAQPEVESDAKTGDDDDKPMMSLKTQTNKKTKTKSTSDTNSSPSAQSSSSSKPTSKPQQSVAKSSSNEPKKSKKSHPKTKLFSGTLRSAAAAHRNRQIPIPPIGSPGLLMLPNPALVANFPNPHDDDNSDKKKKTTIDDVTELLHNGYILPRTVYEQSMIAGGYTIEQRKNNPHRGSSTQRTVGDMFDSDVNLYLHFPELIPLDVWERRLKKKPKVENEVQKTAQCPEQSDATKLKGEDGAKNVTPHPSDQPETVSSSTEEDKGPRLVELVIKSLDKLTANTDLKTAKATSNIGGLIEPESAPSAPTTSLEPAKSGEAELNFLSGTLPQFNPAHPGIRKRTSLHQPMSFLDMIPISLTSTYPPEYVEKRRAYTKAVKEREHLIIESQEAVDDDVDNKEKYQAHKEAWDRMFEYQKQQIAKREAAAEEAERKAAEEAGQRAKEVPENGAPASTGDILLEGGDNAQTNPGNDGAAAQGANIATGESSSNGNNGSNSAKDESSSAKEEKPKEKKKEDPMDYMPQPPQLPPPARHVTVSEIPTPPSPPSVLEIGEASDDVATVDEKERLSKMCVPKVDSRLIQHLDPACFQPTAEGRYFGLLSNSIADPLFVGHAATGIRGVTSGGGTGLATAYTGGGRGAAGLVSGPLRGGMNSWSRETQASNTMPSASSKSAPKKKESSAKTEQKSDMKNNESKQLPEKPPSTSPSSSPPPKKKRRASDSGGVESSGSKKKVARAIPLATGDRCTLATEIASGLAGGEFPDGWTVKTYRRAGGETVGKTDRFWFSPGLNIRFRAKKHAMSFIDILEEPEVNGDEQLAAETYRSRGLQF